MSASNNGTPAPMATASAAPAATPPPPPPPPAPAVSPGAEQVKASGTPAAATAASMPVSPAATSAASSALRPPVVNTPAPVASTSAAAAPAPAPTSAPVAPRAPVALAGPQSTAAQPSAFRPLNVRDALSYLDKVKQQFQNEYEVYDNFLTIMKDFKTQNIDTPGVIDRVSTLFRGHPGLIQGFNTFLPPGYRIDCVVSNPSERGASNTITVTTPNGVSIRTQDVSGGEARDFKESQRSNHAPSPAATTSTSATLAHTTRELSSQQQAATTAATATSTLRRESGTPPIAASASAKKASGLATYGASSFTRPLASPSTYWGASTTPVASGSSTPVGHAPDSSTTTAKTAGPAAPRATEVVQTQPRAVPAASAVSAASVVPGGNAPPLMEFNHAINYVNKIKNRYTREPDTYKTFLEILQTYQKETRPIQEVYTQVTALFHGAPDLLDEFKAFLPDTTAEVTANTSTGAPAKKATTMSEKPKRAGSQQQAPLSHQQSHHQVHQPPGEEKKKRAATGMGERSKAKRAKTHHAVNNETSAMGHNREPTPPPPAQAGQAPYPYGVLPTGYQPMPRVQSAYEMYLSSLRTNSLVQPEEFTFFDRVKKLLDNRDHYTEFLKLLNLFTQEIIDLPTLLAKAIPFFGGNEDFIDGFKELIGWDTCKDGRYEDENWRIDNVPVYDRHAVSLHLMKSFGPSYRKLPDSEVDLSCSGRDTLEWSVLNDDWVAFATWASEGTGAHRKNPFEDALYNSEQERHWYSFQIESLARTIAYFEPLAARLAQMSTEQRSSFRLKRGAPFKDGQAPSVYERILKKVWGKDQGSEIMDALAENPAVAVPIVLSRLKQKDEEWRRAEREWNKVWREVDVKNHYRGLDHQGVTFKATDKKSNMTTKSLTNEIEALKRDGLQKRRDVPADMSALRPRHQFELGIPDRDVLFDVLKLTFSFLDRDQSGFSGPERARVEAFLRLFVPLLLNVPHSDMEANLVHSDNPPPDAEEDDAESEAESMTADQPKKNGFGHGVHRRGGAADLRKRLLSHAATTSARTTVNGAASHVNGTADASSSGEGLVGLLGEQTWIRLSEVDIDASLDAPLPTRRYNFFANTTFYCLTRTIHTLYHRLSAFKQLAAKLAAKKYRRLNPVAVEVGLATPIAIVDGGDNPAENYYCHALELAEKLFDGEVDQQTYEEYLRYMGGIEAYPLFTLDKLIGTAIKHIHTINSDHKCQDLVTLLEKDRAREHTTPRQQIAYRMEAEATLGPDEPLYRLEWIPSESILTMQSLSKEELTLDDALDSKDKLHASWVASYPLTSATEGVGARVQAPLLKRNRVLAAAGDPQEFDIAPGLEAKVSDDSYQLLFVAKTEDFLHRRRSATVEPIATLAATNEQRQKRFREWLARKAEEPRLNGSAGSKLGEDAVMAEAAH